MKKPLSHYIINYISNIYGVIICVPLGFGGLYILYWLGTAAYNNNKISHPGVIIFLAIVFIISLLFFAGSYRSVKKIFDAERELDAANVDISEEPWLANKEWREKRINGYSVVAGEISPFIKWLGLFFIVILPIGFFFIASLYSINSKGLNATNGSFLLISVILIVGLGYQYYKQKKFGQAVCHLKTLPIRIGQAIEADVEIEFPKLRRGFPDGPDGNVELALQFCKSPSNPNRQRIRVIEEFRNNIEKENIHTPGDGTLLIPVHIDIPKPADDDTLKPKIGTFWRLSVKTKFNGMGYQYYFNVPVVSGEH